MKVYNNESNCTDLSNFTHGIAYRLYIGLDDMNTNTQLIPTNIAVCIVKRVCYQYLEGFSLTCGQGGYKDDSGNCYEENNIIIYTVGASVQTIELIASILNKQLNQGSILIEAATIEYEFYEGRISYRC